jgi:hypothetical protein
MSLHERGHEIREVLVKISLIGATQLFATIGIALARDDVPPSSVRPWAPPELPKYEGELARHGFNGAESDSQISINPRKVHNLAELIDIRILIATLTTSLMTNSGRSAWFAGVLMLMVYVIFAMTLYLMPPQSQ